MIWFPRDRFLRVLFVSFGVSGLGAGLFLWDARRDWNYALARFNENAAELNRLEQIAPYPSSNNVAKMKTEVDDYASVLAGLKENLNKLVFPIQPLAPTEFQSRLRHATTAFVEKARQNKIKLPDKFCLGFEDYSSSLPNTISAPLLGQELGQVELLLGVLIEARIDALTSFRRMPLRGEREVTTGGGAPAATKTAPPNEIQRVIERNLIETTFVSTAAAARQFLNRIAGNNEQFFIVRLFRVRNEKDKGPPREVDSGDSTNFVTVGAAQPGNVSPDSKTKEGGVLSFIVGNEHVEVSARIEIVRFTF